MDRRTVLKGGLTLALTSHTTTGVAVTATPQERIEAAISEIRTALSEIYPTFSIQDRNDVVRPMRYVHGGPDLELDPARHCVLIYASKATVGHEDVRWFVHDKSPMLADDGTGAAAYLDAEALS